MSLARRSELRAAIQLAVAHPELQSATYLSGRYGVASWSGRFAVTIRAVSLAGRDIAVRIFREGTGPKQTYSYLEEGEYSHSPHLCGVSWLDRGIKVGSAWWPVVKMEWANGFDLRATVMSCDESSQLWQLASAWRRTCRGLQNLHFSHGDIQSDNMFIEVTRGGSPLVRMIDYDSAWLPGLSCKPREVGHNAYQHPRTTWGPGMESFPSALVYISLRALASEPRLMEYVKVSDGLLFSSSDLRSPESTLWLHLARHADLYLARLTRLLRRWVTGDAITYSSLEEALTDV
jgi:hypothetical protein